MQLVHDVRGVQAITERGVDVGGKEHEVALIIFATGFEVGYGVLDAGYRIVGRGGLSLRQKWKGGPRTHRGFNTKLDDASRYLQAAGNRARLWCRAGGSHTSCACIEYISS